MSFHECIRKSNYTFFRIHTTRVVKANNIKEIRFQNMTNLRFRPIIPLATAPIKIKINAQYPL